MVIAIIAYVSDPLVYLGKRLESVLVHSIDFVAENKVHEVCFALRYLRVFTLPNRNTEVRMY